MLSLQTSSLAVHLIMVCPSAGDKTDPVYLPYTKTWVTSQLSNIWCHKPSGRCPPNGTGTGCCYLCFRYCAPQSPSRNATRFLKYCTLQKVRSLVSDLWSIESPVCACDLCGTVAQIITPGINDHSLISECATGEK